MKTKVSLYLKAGRPCIIDGLASSWPAVTQHRWSLEGLRKHYGNSLFECGKSENDAVVKKMSQYLESQVSSIDSEDPEYLFDSTFEADAPSMLNDYSVPSCFTPDLICLLPENLRPNYRWLLVGVPNTGSDLHIDPLHTSAWNTLIVGTKKWVIIAPWYNDIVYSDLSLAQLQAVARTIVMQSGFELNKLPQNERINIDTNSSQSIARIKDWFNIQVPAQTIPAIDRIKIQDNSENGFSDHQVYCRSEINHVAQLQTVPPLYIFRQHPGETVYIPQGWLHAVLNIETSVAITHNFVPEDVVSRGKFLSALKTSGYLKKEEFRCCKRILMRHKCPPN